MNSPDQSVQFGICTAADADEMAVLLGQVFAERDPPAVAVGLTSAEFEYFVRLFCDSAVEQGLTVVARCASTGKMCGALLTEDSASDLPDDLDRISAKFDPIFDILGQLDEEYHEQAPARHGESVHLFLVGVAREFTGRGIAGELIDRCLDNAVQKGFRLAVTEATNRISQHVFRTRGFTDRVRRSYADHRFDGLAVFDSIAEEVGPMLMDKQLG